MSADTKLMSRIFDKNLKKKNAYDIFVVIAPFLNFLHCNFANAISGKVFFKKA